MKEPNSPKAQKANEILNKKKLQSQRMPANYLRMCLLIENHCIHMPDYFAGTQKMVLEPLRLQCWSWGGVGG